MLYKFPIIITIIILELYTFVSVAVVGWFLNLCMMITCIKI